MHMHSIAEYITLDCWVIGGVCDMLSPKTCKDEYWEPTMTMDLVWRYHSFSNPSTRFLFMVNRADMKVLQQWQWQPLKTMEQKTMRKDDKKNGMNHWTRDEKLWRCRQVNASVFKWVSCRWLPADVCHKPLLD